MQPCAQFPVPSSRQRLPGRRLVHSYEGNKMAAAITVKDVRKSLVKYLPYGGAVGYSVLSLHSMNVPLPHVLTSGRTGHILFHGSLCLSNVGMVVYIFNRGVFDVMKPKPSVRKRLLWSVFGSTSMNLGSLLFWAISKELCPENSLIRAGVALSSSAGLLMIATDYFNAMDELRKGVIAEREIVTDEL